MICDTSCLEIQIVPLVFKPIWNVSKLKLSSKNDSGTPEFCSPALLVLFTNKAADICSSLTISVFFFLSIHCTLSSFYTHIEKLYLFTLLCIYFYYTFGKTGLHVFDEGNKIGFLVTLRFELVQRQVTTHTHHKNHH